MCSNKIGRSTVALVRCGSYEHDEIYSAVKKGFDLLGGVSKFFFKGEKILLKPNVLLGKNPEKCVSTHPGVMRAVALVLQQEGINLSYGDSPAFILPVLHNMRKARLAQVAEELNIPLADFENGSWVSFPNGISSKRLFIVNAVGSSEGILSLPKLKSHDLTRITGAVKNQFGCVPGLTKGEYHARFPNVYDFSTLLVDITAYVKPRFYIMDAVYSMEGNGPQSGTPKKTGFLLLSADPVAVDAIACRCIALDPKFVPTIALGEKAGLGCGNPEKIDVFGESVEDIIDRSFKVTRKPPVSLPQSGISRILRNYTTPRPNINSKRCVKCGMCVDVCPVDPKAVGWFNGDRKRPPSYRYDCCIRCFCCQEICPYGAIFVKIPLLRRLIPPFSYLSLLASKIFSRRK